MQQRKPQQTFSRSESEADDKSWNHTRSVTRQACQSIYNINLFMPSGKGVVPPWLAKRGVNQAVLNPQSGVSCHTLWPVIWIPTQRDFEIHLKWIWEKKKEPVSNKGSGYKTDLFNETDTIRLPSGNYEMKHGLTKMGSLRVKKTNDEKHYKIRLQGKKIWQQQGFL